MKQSTFSAVMANSIKNLLQGYTKGIRFVAILTVLLTMGIGQAWGAENCSLTSSGDVNQRMPNYEAGYNMGTINVWFSVNGASYSQKGSTSSNINQDRTITNNNITSGLKFNKFSVPVYCHNQWHGDACNNNGARIVDKSLIMYWKVFDPSGTMVNDGNMQTTTNVTLSWSGNGATGTWTSQQSEKDLLTGVTASTTGNQTYTMDFWYKFQCHMYNKDGNDWGSNVNVWYPGNSQNFKYQFTIPKTTLTVSQSGANGGATVSSGINKTIALNTEYSLTASEVTGYDFVNWTTSNNNITITNATSRTGAKVKFTSFANATVTANYKAKNYTVKWEVNGETYTAGSPTTSVAYNSKVTKLPTAPSIDCNGKVFVGWSNQEVTNGLRPAVLFTTAGDAPQVTENTTYRAVFATEAAEAIDPIIFANQGWENDTELSSHNFFDGLINFTFDKNNGINAPKYYDTGSAIRLYYNNKMTIASTSDEIQTITFHFVTKDANGNSISADTGEKMDKTPTNASTESLTHTWTVNSNSVVFTIGSYFDNSGTEQLKGHCKISRIDITTTGAGTSYSDYTTECEETIVTWTINPAGGGVLSQTTGTSTTVTPNAGYTYASSAYTITPAGAATVAKNGNVFTATPTKSCTIQINMMEQLKNTYIDQVQGNAEQTFYGAHTTPLLADKAESTTGTCKQLHWHFMGWVTTDDKDNPADDNIIASNTNVTADGTTYYAVWASTGESAPIEYTATYGFEDGDFGWTVTNINKYSDYKASGSNSGKCADNGSGTIKTPNTIEYSAQLGTPVSISFKSSKSGTNTTSSNCWAVQYSSNKSIWTNLPNGAGPNHSDLTKGEFKDFEVDLTSLSNVYIRITHNGSSPATLLDDVKLVYEIGGGPAFDDYITACITTISFDLNGGEGDFEDVVLGVNEDTYTIPSTEPTKEGYDFAGWKIDGGDGTVYDANDRITNINASITLVAQWDAIKYTIKYTNLKGATNPSANPANYTIEDEITFVAPTENIPAGYTFAGWSPNKISRGTMGEITVTAQWNIVNYTITYVDLKGATNPPANPSTYTVEDAITFEALTNIPEGYIFKGWQPSQITIGTTGNQTVTAQWERIEYTVTWYVNGEEYNVGTPDKNVYHGDKVESLPTPPTPDEGNNVYCGEVFAGWTDKPIDGQTDTYPDPLFTTIEGSPAIKQNTTFYAVFADYKEQ